MGAHPFERALHVAFGHGDDPSITLHRLDDHPRQMAGGRVPDHPVEIVQIGLRPGPEGAAVLIGFSRERDVRQLPGVVPEAHHAGQRLRPVGRAVVGIPERDHVHVAGRQPRHHQCKVNRFGPGIGEVDHPVVARRQRGGQFLGEMRRDGMVEHRRAMGQLFDLRLHRRDHPRMGMADADAEVHAQEVDQPDVMFVPDILPLTALDDQRLFIRHEGPLRRRIVLVALGNDLVRRPCHICRCRLLSVHKESLSAGVPPRLQPGRDRLEKDGQRAKGQFRLK